MSPVRPSHAFRTALSRLDEMVNANAKTLSSAKENLNVWPLMRLQLSSLFQIALLSDYTEPFLLTLPLSTLPQEDALRATGHPLPH